MGGHSSCQALKETILCTSLIKTTQSQSVNRIPPKPVLKSAVLAVNFWLYIPDWFSKAICMDGTQAMPRQAVLKRFVPVMNFDELT